MNGLTAKYKLSKSELKVVSEIIRGLTNKEVGNNLFVSEKTIKFHLTNIYKKMGVQSRSQLIVKVMMNKDEVIIAEKVEEPAVAPI